MEIYFILSILGLLLLLEFIEFSYQIYKKHRGMKLLNKQWGNPIHDTLLLEDVKYIHRRSNRDVKDDESSIDDITWNDLDMDELYQQMNYCSTSSGDIELMKYLRYPLIKESSLNQRKKMMKMIIENEKARNQLCTIFISIGRRSEIEWSNAWNQEVPLSKNTSMALSGTLILSLIVGIFYPPAFLASFALAGSNCFTAYQNAKKLGAKSYTLLYMMKYVEAVHALAKSAIDPKLKEELKINECSKKLNKLHRSWFENLNDGNGIIMMIISQVFLGEAISFSRLESRMSHDRDAVMQAIELIGQLEASYSIISYQQAHPTYCEVSFHEDKNIIAHEMVHPMLNKPVSNDINLFENLLISGSNASGKSTFLKMIAINAIFAQSFGFAFAKDYVGCFFRIYTSMSLRDSIDNGDSYFIAEIKSIKRILEANEKDVPKLCMIDEILRGTNTNERIAAASEILHCLCDDNTITLGATHDIELTKILTNHYTNIHFNETIKDNQMLFDYKLKSGPSDSRNAIALLKIVGYDEQVVKAADHRLSLFEKQGVWVKEMNL